MSPLAATRTNLSYVPPALYPEKALLELKIMPNIVVNSGLISRDSHPSTIVKINNEKVEILREGSISLLDIQKIIQDSS